MVVCGLLLTNGELNMRLTAYRDALKAVHELPIAIATPVGEVSVRSAVCASILATARKDDRLFDGEFVELYRTAHPRGV